MCASCDATQIATLRTIMVGKAHSLATAIVVLMDAMYAKTAEELIEENPDIGPNDGSEKVAFLDLPDEEKSVVATGKAFEDMAKAMTVALANPKTRDRVYAPIGNLIAGALAAMSATDPNGRTPSEILEQDVIQSGRLAWLTDAELADDGNGPMSFQTWLNNWIAERLLRQALEGLMSGVGTGATDPITEMLDDLGIPVMDENPEDTQQ